MIERMENFRDKLSAILQEHVGGERILALGVFARKGAWGSLSASLAGGVVAGLAKRRSKKRAGELPAIVALAITPTKVHVFGYKAKGLRIEVDTVAEWDRSSIRVATGEGVITEHLRLELAEGGAVELEGMRIGGGAEFNHDAIRLLLDPSAT